MIKKKFHTGDHARRFGKGPSRSRREKSEDKCEDEEYRLRIDTSAGFSEKKRKHVKRRE